MDLKDYIFSLIQSHPKNEKATAQNIIAFMTDNDWFGCKPEMTDGKVLLTEDQIQRFALPMETFLSTEATRDAIYGMFADKYPVTAGYWDRFSSETELDDDLQFYILDFLLAFLQKDLPLYTDEEARSLVNKATMELTKTCGEGLTFFMSWLRVKAKTHYYSDFIMQRRYKMDIQNEAYSLDEYLELMYYIFNETYITEHDMYRNAAESKDYTDAWLYLCMHYICSLRLTDLHRIYHPDLMYPPDVVIDQIANDAFSDVDARLVLLSITERMATLPFAPSKTDGTAGVGSVKLSIPHSCETLFGRLFALAEAHRQLAGNPTEPIIRKISTYTEITRIMGDEIGALFLESDFRSRSATKSYLQAIFMMADDALGSQKATIKGYILASMARSHKGGYGEFAQTTITYIKDMRLNSLDSKFVMFELLERGVLSFIPAMLLDSITNQGYSALDVSNQTKLLKDFSISAYEANTAVDAVMKGRTQAKDALSIAFQSGEDILTVVQRIASGQAFSKEADCLCLNSACGKLCPYPSRSQCVGCEYEISTKSTLFLLISEYRRMKKLYETAEDDLEKEKYKHLTTKLILPKLNEILICLKKAYGEEVFSEYMELLNKYKT